MIRSYLLRGVCQNLKGKRVGCDRQLPNHAGVMHLTVTPAQPVSVFDIDRLESHCGLQKRNLR